MGLEEVKRIEVERDFQAWVGRFLIKLWWFGAVWSDLFQGLELRHVDVPRPTAIAAGHHPKDWALVDLSVIT